MENVDMVFKGITREPYIWGVPLGAFIIGGGIILIIGLTIWHPLLLLLIPFYFSLYFLTKADDKFFSVFGNFLKTSTFKKDRYNKVKTYSTGAKYRDLKNYSTKLSIHPINKISKLEEFIPYSTHITSNIVVTKDNKYIATWAIDGTVFDMVDDFNLLGEKASLNMLIRALSSENVSIYTHSSMLPYSDRLDYKYEATYLKDFADEYYNNMDNSDLHISLKYLTIVYTPLASPIEISQFAKMKEEKKAKKIKSFIFQMNELSTRIESVFSKYGVSRLGYYEENNTTYSTLLEFFNFLIAGEFNKIKVLNYPISEYLTGGASSVKFNKSLMQVDYANGKRRYAKSLEIKDLCTETYVGILDALLQSQITYTITQAFTPMDKRKAKTALSLQKKRLIGTEDDGLSQIEGISIALDKLISDEISFGEYHFSILIYNDTAEELKKDIEIMKVKLEDIGHLVVASEMSFPATYFSQFPSNLHLRPRITPISSLNFSAFLSFHAYLLGRRDNNPWGQAAALISTPSKNPYYLNLHSMDKKDDFGKLNLGNSLVIGQAGSGKTAFLSFLVNMMMKYDNKSTFPSKTLDKYKNFSAIYLDKKYGAMANILAAGGKYIILKNGENTGFNPFMCENNQKNIRRLEILVRMMIGDKVKVPARAEQKITDAIQSIMNEFEKKEREYPITLLLENISEDTDTDNSIKTALKLWTKGEKFGWVFDNKSDSLNINDNKIIGIDGTEFLNDKEVSSLMTYYILWRIVDLRDGKRLGIWIDEAWEWIKNPNVAEEVHNSFKTNRSFNNFIIMGVQSVVDFLQNKYSRAIIEQSSSIFLFSNPKAVEEDYVKGISCSMEEYLRVKNFRQEDYNFLIKRNEGSVIGSMDLSNMDSFYIDTLSTDIGDVEPIQEIFSREISHEEKLAELKKYFEG